MVATRIERAEKLARQTPIPRTPLPRTGTISPRPRRGEAVSSTLVNSYVVGSYANGETLACPQEGESGAVVDFRFPYGLTLEDNHLMAVQFLRRRGPDFAPAGERVVITLDARGRKCGEEKL